MEIEYNKQELKSKRPVVGRGPWEIAVGEDIGHRSLIVVAGEGVSRELLPFLDKI
jgi:hypothetical protein